MEHQTTTIVKFISTKDKALQVETAVLEDALSRMGHRILNLAKMYAPVDSGDLVADGRLDQDGAEVTISFGGLSVPYARRRHYENNLHPNTKFYLERAGDQITKQGLDLK